jgi:DnaJ-domain-containing protein 1
MSKEFLGDRRAALEEAFFAKKDRELLQRLRELDQARQTKEGLSAASGITDESVLEKLAALNIDSDTLAALSVVPLVAVAWADGSISDSERRSAFAKAAEMGLSKQDISHRLFERWLAEPPPAALLAAWKGYVKALSATRDGESKHALKQGVLSRARTVAEAAGGFLGIGGKVSPAEERVLKELEQAFSE